MIKIIGFSATWCPNCPRMKPVWEELSKTFDVTVIDVDENPEVAAEYGIKSMPSSIVLKDDKVVGMVVGARPASFIKDKINSLPE